MKVTITIEDGETRTISFGDAERTIPEPGMTGEEKAESPFDGGLARAVVGPEESTLQGTTEPTPGSVMDAGPAPIIDADGQTGGLAQGLLDAD